MPQILVVTDPPGEAASTVVYRERIEAADLESDHFSGQLVERVGWAVQDAGQIERDPGAIPPQSVNSAISTRPSSAASRSAS
ncbi:MAG: hypothetical protein ACRDLL_12760 [Solirubrobacterales bacterium]